MPSALALGQLAFADWLVLAVYFAALIAAGVWANLRKATTTEDYFLASRSMPVWAVAFSIVSTAQSAATYVGVPAASYGGDLTYLSSSIGGVIAAFVLAWFFIPAYYRLGVGTPYQLLTSRFGETGRIAAASAYLVGRVFASGARVFVAAIPAAIVLFGEDAGPAHQAILIVFFTILGIALCYAGGVRSVIWLDVLQVSVYIGAAIVTIIYLFSRIDADPTQIIAALETGGPKGESKLRALSLSTEPAVQFTLWTALTGFVLLTLASHGADQDLVQRMLTCKSPAKGAWSVISGVLIGVPAVAVFLLLGLLLWFFFHVNPGADPTVAPVADKAFQIFAQREMVGWGGAGLVIAGLFACGPAGINSGLSAMASSFVGDIYRPLRNRREAPTESSAADDLRVGHQATIGAGIALGLMALLCVLWYDPANSTILTFVLSVMTFAYAGLLGVFLTALFTPRGNATSCIAALIVGAVTQVAFQAPVWKLFTDSDSNKPPSFPWQLTLGVGIAFLVCWAGRPGKPSTPGVS